MLTLRKFKSTDRSNIIDILNCPDVTQFLSSRIPSPYTVDDADWWLAEGCNYGYIRAIDINGRFAGCIGVESGQHEHAFTGDVGYWLAKEYWQQGYATKALNALIQSLPSNTFARLQAKVFQGNIASEKVLKNCGFKKEAVLDNALFKNNTFYKAVLYGKVV